MIDSVEVIEKIFSYPRCDEFAKGRACENIRQLLENAGYVLRESDNGCSHNIETECDEPAFVIITHYDGSEEMDGGTAGFMATLLLSQMLAEFRRKVKFIFFDDENKWIERRRTSNSVLGFHIEILRVKNRVAFEVVQLNDKIKCNNNKEMKKAAEMMRDYIVGELW